MSKKELNLKLINEKCEYYFLKNAPFHIPENIKEIIVKYGPYALIELFIISIPLTLYASFLSFIDFASGNILKFISNIIMFIGIIFYIMSFPGLLNRKLKGWDYLFYSILIYAVYVIFSTIVNLNFFFIFSILRGAIYTIIGLYILYQIKNLYNE